MLLKMPKFSVGPFLVGFVVYKMALGQSSCQYFGSCLSLSSHQCSVYSFVYHQHFVIYVIKTIVE
jgi:hypothetical protein